MENTHSYFLYQYMNFLFKNEYHENKDHDNSYFMELPSLQKQLSPLTRYDETVGIKFVDQLMFRREWNVLFNDALNTFYLRLYGVRHMVKDHSDSEKGNPLLPHRLLID